MAVANASYQAGKAAAGAERIDTDAIWVKGLGALERQPDAIICVDVQLFNRRFLHAIKR